MTVGGTGIGKRDITVDTLEPLLERKLDGLMEAARSFGQNARHMLQCRVE